MYDLIIQNGTLIDGSGMRMRRADIGVNDGRIATIGTLRGEAAERVLDASEGYVAPGFIDLNNHSDTYWSLMSDPRLESLVRQGVTTIVGGNSGASLAPLLTGDSIRSIQKWTDIRTINFDWLSMKDFLQAVERRRPHANFATLVGHATLRRGLVGDEARPLTDDELKVMQKTLRRAYQEGAFGLSFGLVFAHARPAERKELIALAQETARAGRLTAFHLRDEGRGLVSAVEEVIAVAKAAEGKLHISHFKAVGESRVQNFERALYLLENAHGGGLSVSFDLYPYSFTATVLYTFLPPWVSDGGRSLMLERLRDASVRAKAVSEMRAEGLDFSSALLFTSTVNKMIIRHRLGDIAAAQQKLPEEVAVDLLLASEGRALVSFDALPDDLLERALQHPFAVVSTNGVGYPTDPAKHQDGVHPRSFGTFPRVLGRYVRDRKALSWEEAVHKMTGRPAELLGLPDRGLLREGYAADIVVFQPKTVADTATLEKPASIPAGIRSVVINGEIALHEGVLSAQPSGQVLRKAKKGWF